jgi:hypothetical protein
LEEKAKLRGPEPEPAPPSSEKGPDLSLPGAAAPGAEAAAQTAVLEAPAPAAESQSARKRALLLKNHEEVERLTARLKYLCRIISKERRPYCATNGILCLLPFAAAENDANASQAGMILKQDLAAAREALQVHCPVYVMVCDLETEPGFRDFVPKLNAEQRRQATGQPFPLQPDIVATDFPVLLEAGVRWLADVQLPSQVYRHFGVETGEQKAEEATDANSRLYHLVSNVRERQRRLTRILGRSVLDQEPPLFGGCFVGGTGVDANREQAFVNGVFRTMLENQNYVSWTKDALSENADYLRWTRIGYLTIFLVAATVLALAIFHWWRPAWPF